MSLRDGTTTSNPVGLSQDDIANFLAWDTLNNNGLAQAYLDEPQVKPDGITVNWNGRQILVWVDAANNDHFIDVTGDNSFISAVNAPAYTSGAPGSPTAYPCTTSIAGICLDPLTQLLQYGGWLLVGFLVWSLTRKD